MLSKVSNTFTSIPRFHINIKGIEAVLKILCSHTFLPVIKIFYNIFLDENLTKI